MHLLTRKLLAPIKAGKLFYFPKKGKGGGVSSVSPAATAKYFKRIINEARSRKLQPIIPEVRALYDTVLSDPVIRMCLQGSLDTLANADDQNVPLTNCTIEDTMRAINTVAITPPKFSDQQIIGVPFSILFFGLLNNYYGQGFFGNPQVNLHLKKIFDVYGDLLRSPKSQQVLNPVDGWLCPDAQKWVNYNDFKHNPKDMYYGYKCWNDWFIRQLVPGARPIDPNPKRIVMSSDSYCLNPPRQPVFNIQKWDSFWLKDDKYSVFDMFGVVRQKTKDPQLQKIVEQSFVGGTIYQAFLSPWCYHRWHAPFGGKLERSYALQGTYLLENPTSNLLNSGQDNYVNTQPLLTSFSARHIYIINTGVPALGRVAVIEIGMGEVSSCKSIVNQGQDVQKGQELGRFEFGGSSHAVIFDKRAQLAFNRQIYNVDSEGEPELQKVGKWLAEFI